MITKKEIASLEIKVDPCHQMFLAISWQHEYEPGELCHIWLAREMEKDTAELIVKLLQEHSNPSK